VRGSQHHGVAHEPVVNPGRGSLIRCLLVGNSENDVCHIAWSSQRSGLLGSGARRGEEVTQSQLNPPKLLLGLGGGEIKECGGKRGRARSNRPLLSPSSGVPYLRACISERWSAFDVEVE